MKTKLVIATIVVILAAMYTVPVFAEEVKENTEAVEQETKQTEEASSVEDVKIMYVNSDNGLHVRTQPSSNATSLGKLGNNSPVAVLCEFNPDEDSDFTKAVNMVDKDKKWAICIYNNAAAFICSDYLVEAPKNAETETVSANVVNVIIPEAKADGKIEAKAGVSNNTLSSNSVKLNAMTKVKDLGTYKLTAYEWTGNKCANGKYPRKGYTVAANDLPLGTKVLIEGYGVFTVEDRGGFSGKTIDIYLGDEDECNRFGRKYANVKILNG